MVARQLPGAADAIPRLRRDEGHLLDILGRGLEIVEGAGGRDGVREGRVGGHVSDLATIDIDGAAVLEAFDMLLAGLYHGGSCFPSWMPTPGFLPFAIGEDVETVGEGP